MKKKSNNQTCGKVSATKTAKNAKAGGRVSSRAAATGGSRLSRPHRVVLVGTYKAGQLSQWRGWYNYPISEADTIGAIDAA